MKGHDQQESLLMQTQWYGLQWKLLWASLEKTDLLNKSCIDAEFYICGQLLYNYNIFVCDV